MKDTDATVKKAAGSVKWSALIELISRSIGPVTFVVLARLLSPGDFGLIATAMTAITFSQMFWDAGLSKALVQTREDPREAADVVFWVNLVLGVIVYLIVFIGAPWIAAFFKSPGSAGVLRVLGAQIVIASLTSVQQALFVRDLDFRSLFWIKLSTGLVPAAFSIPLAVVGFGVWALVAGALAGQTLNLVLLWSRSSWRPRIQFRSELARKLFGFGVWAVGESLMSWFMMWGDNVVVGRFLGMHDLGVYRTGWMIVNIVFGLVLNPFLPVLYPMFSRLQDDLPALRSVFGKANRVVMALALPMGVGLLVVGEDIANILFGAKWLGLGMVLSVIGFQQSLSWVVSINSEVYRAISRPDINAKLIFLYTATYLVAYVISAQFGLKAFVYTRLFISLPTIPIHIYLFKRILGVPPTYLWEQGKNTIFASLLMGAAILLVKQAMIAVSAPYFVSIVTVIVCGVALYGVFQWLIDRSFLVYAAGLVKRVVAM